MLNKNMSRAEIEKILEDKGDYVQIDYLTRFLEEKPPLVLKRFAYKRLAKIYEKKKMFSYSAKMFERLAEACVTFSDKIEYFSKAAEVYIESGNFDKSDYALKKALHNANTQERLDIYSQIKNFYFKKAQIYEKEEKRASAIKIYEKLESMNLAEIERKKVKERLLDLYEKTGRFKDYNLLKNLSGKSF